MVNRISSQQRSRQRLQFEVNDLAGGFVTQAASYRIDSRFVEDVQNMELVQGMWQKRKGFHLAGSFAPIISNEGTCKGMHVFNLQGNLHILGAYRNILYDTYQVTKHDSGRVLTSYLPTTKRVRFTDFRNKCYIAHGQDGILMFDGDKIQEMPSPAGSIIATYDNRLILGGIKGDPLVIYFSERGDGRTWNALNYIVLDGGSEEKITALIPLQGKLFIFTNHSIYSLLGTMEDFSVSKEVEGVGAVSPEAIQVLGNHFYFMTENGKIYDYDGGTYPQEISYPISHYLESTFAGSAFQNVVTTQYKNSVWFTLDNTYIPEKRITLVYYPEYQAWTKFVGIPAAYYVYLNDTLFFTGVHNEGSIYQFGTQYKDDLRFIEGRFKTVKWSFDALENIKRFKELYIRGAVQGGGGNGFDIDFIVDDSQVASIRVTSDIATETEIWGENNWNDMYWGFAPETAGTFWGQAEWAAFEWAGAEIKYSPKWGASVWGAFNWGDHQEGTLQEDVGKVYRKIYLSQYNIISGKTLQMVFRDHSPDHGYRFEHLLLEYIQKGAR